MVTVNEVAKRLNKSPQFVRVGLQQGILPFGHAVKTSSRYSYVIYENKLNEYIGE